MALSIKTEEADRLARQLAKSRGVSITEAVTAALREALERARKPTDTMSPKERATRLLERADELFKDLDRRPLSREEIALAGNDAWDDEVDAYNSRGVAESDKT